MLRKKKQISKKDVLLKEIINDIVIAKRELASATQKFNMADNSHLTDMYSYQITAARLKYDYLIKKARENGLSYECFLDDNVTAF